MYQEIQTGLLQSYAGKQFYSDLRTAERFMKKVRFDESGCWLWTGATVRGYGHFGCNTPSGTQMVRCSIYVHAVMNKQNAPTVRHTCDNPICVNPGHLISGTHKENSQDAVLRGRQARGSSVVSNQKAKLLTEDLVKEIFHMQSKGLTQAAIARELGYSAQQVNRVINRKIWAWVIL